MLKIRTVAIIGFISLSVFWFIGTAVSQTNSTTNASGGIAITPIQKGVQYVVNNAAEAIKHFKIPTDRIAQKLEAKVGLKAIETNLAATASPVPGVTSPLAPVPAVHSEA